MQRPKDGRDDDVEIPAKRIVCRMTHDFGDCITPLMNDAVAIDGHAGAHVSVRRPGSVHTLVTVPTGIGFTTRLADQGFARSLQYAINARWPISENRLVEVLAVAVSEFEYAIGDFDGNQYGTWVNVGADELCLDEFGVNALGKCSHPGVNLPGNRC